MSKQGVLKLVDTDEVGKPTEGGGYLISAETLKVLGKGDVKQGRRMIRMMIADEREPKVRRGPTPKPESVRMAGRDDEEGVLALIYQQVKRQAGHVMPIDPGRILDHVRMGTRHLGGLVGVIDAPDGNGLAACAVIVPCQSAFSRMWYLSEVFNIVHPDHRKSRFGEDVVDFGLWASDDWSRGFGYPVPIVSMVTTDDNMREKLRFYRRKMNQVGATFTYPYPTKV